MTEFYKKEDVIDFLNLHCPKDMWEYQITDLNTIKVNEYVDKEQAYMIGYEHGRIAGTLLKDDWIPVSERLPEKNGNYIVSLEDAVDTSGRFFNGKWFMSPIDSIAREYGEHEVLAWMPRPEPFNKKQVTGKLKKPCNSLLKADSDECKEQKSKLECISRQQAIEAIDEVVWYRINSKGELVQGSTSDHESWYKAEDIYEAIKSLPPVIPTVSEVCISKRVISDSLLHRISELNAQGEKAIPITRELIRFKRFVDGMTPVVPKPVMTEEAREALMRLSMCAREECAICKYENNCGFDKQVEMAAENTNIIFNAFDTTPTERSGEWIVYPLMDDGRVELECPKCGDTFIRAVDYRPHFCENCGAKMKG